MIITASSPNDRGATLIFAALLGLGAWLLLVAGPAPQLRFPSDDAAYLDACHRAALGQWLGRDFGSPIGPAALLPTVVAMKMGGATVHALANGAALTWLAYGIIAWGALRGRMPAWLTVGFALFVAATAAAPYPLDFGSWRILSYGMLYNRLAWAAVCVAAGATLLPRRDATTQGFVVAGLGAGAIWLWAIKPNYVIILLPLLLYDGWSSPQRGSWLGRAAIGALGMLLLVWTCVRFSPLAYIGNHLGMAREASHGLVAYSPARLLQENFWPVLGLVTLWVVVLKNAAGTVGRGRLGLTLGAVIVCTFLASLANNQFSEIPLWGALSWLAAAFLAVHGSPGRLTRIVFLAGIAGGLAFTWQPLAAVAYNYAWKNYRAPGNPAAREVVGSAWQGLPMRPMPGEPSGAGEALESAGNYAAWLNDGLALLARVRPPQGAVLCLDWVNPFPFATGTVPAPGDEIAWHVGRTVGEFHHPDPARLLAAASVVMEPRRSIQPDSLAFKRVLFGPGLQAAFTVAGETAHWRAWVRRDNNLISPAAGR